MEKRGWVIDRLGLAPARVRLGRADWRPFEGVILGDLGISNLAATSMLVLNEHLSFVELYNLYRGRLSTAAVNFKPFVHHGVLEQFGWFNTTGLYD